MLRAIKHLQKNFWSLSIMYSKFHNTLNNMNTCHVHIVCSLEKIKNSLSMIIGNENEHNNKCNMFVALFTIVLK